MAATVAIVVVRTGTVVVVAVVDPPLPREVLFHRPISLATANAGK